MKRACWVHTSSGQTDRQALKAADQCSKMRKQEQMHFSSELIITSEPETKKIVLEMERRRSISDPNTMFKSKKKLYCSDVCIAQIRAYLQITTMPEQINKCTVINGINTVIEFVLGKWTNLHQRIYRADRVPFQFLIFPVKKRHTEITTLVQKE